MKGKVSRSIRSSKLYQPKPLEAELQLDGDEGTPISIILDRNAEGNQRLIFMPEEDEEADPGKP